jgi:hypothetical protein
VRKAGKALNNQAEISGGETMAGGGARQGAGRKGAGEVGTMRRLILRGGKKGLALAAAKRGATGTEDELVEEAVSMVVQDMMAAGQGREALALVFGALPKEDPKPGAGASEGLGRLPGEGETGDHDAGMSPLILQHEPGPSAARPAERGTLAEKCNVPENGVILPFFDPQARLALDLPADGRGGTPAGGRPPHPPAAPPAPSIPVHTKNFEKFQHLTPSEQAELLADGGVEP